MECEEITQTAIVLQIVQNTNDSRLQKLFHCIYHLFQDSFLNWIMNKYSAVSSRNKLWEDAKDAFQNGVMMFYHKSRNEDFSIKGSLKTTIYSFGLLQLLAFFKKEKPGYSSSYLKCLELFFEEDFENARQELLNERENELMQALAKLPEKQREIISMKFFEKLASRQIAEKLGVTSGNVDNNSTKAYKELRNILKSKYSFQK